MHYRPKDVPRIKRVCDADAVMREFNRAERAANEVDQNNLKNLGILTAHATAPSSGDEGTSFTHNEGTTLLVTNPNAGTAETLTVASASVSVRGVWIPVLDGAASGVTAALTFTTKTSMWLTVIGQVELKVAAGTSAPYQGVRLRLIVDGEQLDTVDTSHAIQLAAATAYWSCYVEENVFLGPGDHEVSMQVADLRMGDGELIQSNRRTIIAMGFPS